MIEIKPDDIRAPDNGDSEDDGINYKSALIQTESSHSVTLKRRITVEPIIALYIFAHTATHQILEQLVYTVISEQHGVTSIVRQDQDKIHCSGDRTDPETAIRLQIQSEASYWLTYMRISVSFPSIIAAYVWGNMSDRLPRKLPILFTLIANMLLIALCTFVVMFKLPMSVILVGYFLEGLGGSTNTFLMGCYAYLASVSTKEERTSRINVNEIFVRVAHGGASYILGQMLKSLGFLVPFYVILCLYILGILYTMYILPAVNAAITTNSKNHTYSGMISVFTKARSGRGRCLICLLGAIYFLIAMACISRYSVNMLFIQNEPFCWNAKSIGVFFSTDSILQSLWNIVVLLCLQKRLGDIGVLSSSLVCSIIHMGIVAFSTTGKELYISLLFAAPHHILFTVMRGLMSKSVASNEQGAVFSSIAFIELLILLFGTPIYNVIYAETVAVFRGFVYVLSALFYLAALIITLISGLS